YLTYFDTVSTLKQRCCACWVRSLLMKVKDQTPVDERPPRQQKPVPHRRAIGGYRGKTDGEPGVAHRWK
ncbi:MAG: hypothetical protein ACKE51_00770, partial [Methylococcaceae bacterium]